MPPNPPPARDTAKDVLSFSSFSGSTGTINNVGRSPLSEAERERKRKQAGKRHSGKKGGILPSSSETFGCENEKTDLQNTPVDIYFDKSENCIHGNVSAIIRCFDIKVCPGFHYVDDGLGGSRYKLACPGARGLGAIRRGAR